MTLSEALHAIADDTAAAREAAKTGGLGFIDVCASSATAVLTETAVKGGMVRVTFVPNGAADPVKTADETIKRLSAAAVK